MEQWASATPEKTGRKAGANWLVCLLAGLAKCVVVLFCACLVAVLLRHLALSGGSGATATASSVGGAIFMDKFDMFMVNKTSDALEGVLDIEKVY